MAAIRWPKCICFNSQKELCSDDTQCREGPTVDKRRLHPTDMETIFNARTTRGRVTLPLCGTVWRCAGTNGIDTCTDRCEVYTDRCEVYTDRCEVYTDRCDVYTDRCEVYTDRCEVCTTTARCEQTTITYARTATACARRAWTYARTASTFVCISLRCTNG